MKFLSYFAALFLTASTLSAQKINLKKNVIYVDEVAAFSFDKKAMGNELFVYKLNTKEELVNMIVDNNKTESNVDDSKKMIFANQNTTIQSKNFRSQSWEFLISLLLQEKVFDLKGELNLENLKRFWAKYDQNNVNHTMMR